MSGSVTDNEFKAAMWLSNAEHTRQRLIDRAQEIQIRNAAKGVILTGTQVVAIVLAALTIWLVSNPWILAVSLCFFTGFILSIGKAGIVQTKTAKLTALELERNRGEIYSMPQGQEPFEFTESQRETIKAFMLENQGSTHISRWLMDLARNISAFKTGEDGQKILNGCLELMEGEKAS